MIALNKKVLGFVLTAGLLVATFGTARAQVGIPSYYMGHYRHATQVLQQEYPAFLTAFKSFPDEIKTIDSADKQAQHEAMMRFFPFMKELANMDSWKADSPDAFGVKWTLQLEVLVSHFVLDLPTADNQITKLYNIVFDSFKVELAGGDATGILSEEQIMKKHNMSREQAQEVREVLHKLYPTNTLL